jgi:hypothetical protein
MEAELQKQEENKPQRDEKGQLLPGNTANPNGRPKGKTIKERVREYLEAHPDDMDAFVRHFIHDNRELAWKMLEGNPAQDVTSAGERINPTPILGGITNNKDAQE